MLIEKLGLLLLSSNTGAYNQARQALPLSVVQTSCTASLTNWPRA
jgi:hypothetical protein